MLLNPKSAYFRRASRICSVMLLITTFRAPTVFSDEAAQQNPTSSSLPVDAKPAATEQAGIGAALRIEAGRVFIRTILPDTPAAAQGVLRPEDEVLEVAQADGKSQSVAGLDMNAVVGMIRGPVGSTVRLTVFPSGKKSADAQVVSLTRARVSAIDKFVDGRLLPVGESAPDFQMWDLTADDSSGTKLSSFHNRIVVVEFWATWCRPCLKQIEHLQAKVATYPEWQDNVTFLMVSVDEERELAATMAKERHWTGLRVMWAGPEVLKQFRVGGIPTIFVLDWEGKVKSAGSSLPIEEQLAPLLQVDD